MKYLFYFSALLFLINGCTEDEAPPVQDVDLRIKNVAKNGVLSRTYEYYGDNDLKTSTQFGDDGAQLLKINYSYSGDTTIAEILDEYDVLQRFLKYFPNGDGDNIEIWTLNTLGGIYEVRIDEFDTPGCSTTKVIMYNGDGDERWQFISEYSGSNCNESSQFILAGSTEPSYIKTIERDGKRNSSEAAGIKALPIIAGNVIANTRTEQGVVNNGISYTSEFTYNDLNFPLTETRTFFDGNIDEYTFEYY